MKNDLCKTELKNLPTFGVKLKLAETEPETGANNSENPRTTNLEENGFSSTDAQARDISRGKCETVGHDKLVLDTRENPAKGLAHFLHTAFCQNAENNKTLTHPVSTDSTVSGSDNYNIINDDNDNKSGDDSNKGNIDDYGNWRSSEFDKRTRRTRKGSHIGPHTSGCVSLGAGQTLTSQISHQFHQCIIPRKKRRSRQCCYL